MIQTYRGPVIAMYVNGQRILSAYTQGQKIWPDEIINEILSCYYSGYWIDEYPWTDDTPWKD